MAGLTPTVEATFEQLVDGFNRTCRRGELAIGVDAGGQQALREQERRFRNLLEALPVAVYTTDERGRLTFFNQAAVEFSGRTPQLGDMWCVTWRLYHPDGTPLPHDQCPLAVTLRENRPVRNAETIAERPDGTRIHFMPYPTPLREADGTLVGAVNMLVDITHRKQSEDRLKLLAREVDHRANNLLAIVQATIALTQADSADAFKKALSGRIGALARAHSLLAADRWIGADLHQLFEDELAPFAQAESDTVHQRVHISGSEVVLDPVLAQSLAVIIHELTTNAAKYGALSQTGGEVDIWWQHDPDGRLSIAWEERGGPAVTPPTRRGFGIRAIEGMLRHQLSGDIAFDWGHAGLRARLQLSPVAADGR